MTVKKEKNEIEIKAKHTHPRFSREMHHAEAVMLSNKLLNDHHLEKYYLPTFTFGIYVVTRVVSH